MRRILILGGGTSGTLVANRLRRMLPARDADIVVVDQDDRHVYQPGLLFVPFGLADPDEITRPRHPQLHAGIGFRRAVGRVSSPGRRGRSWRGAPALVSVPRSSRMGRAAAAPRWPMAPIWGWWPLISRWRSRW